MVGALVIRQRKILIVALTLFLAATGIASGIEDTCLTPVSSDSVIARTVSVTVERPGTTIPETGFGFLALASNQTGYFVSVAHLFEGLSADPIVHLRFNPDSTVKDAIVATLKAVDKEHDLALLQATLPPDFDDSEIPSDPALYRGQEVWFAGRLTEWYVPVQPGLVNQVGDDGRFVIDHFDILPGSSGAPVFSTVGLAGLVTNKVPGQTGYAIGILPILKFLTDHVPIDLDTPLMRAMRFVHGQNFAKAFVDQRRKESEARVAKSGPDSGDLPGEFSLGDVMLSEGEEFSQSDETLFFDWTSEGDGGGNHFETYVTTVPLRSGGKTLSVFYPTTTLTGRDGVGQFGVDYASTVCTRDQSRISLKGCLSDGTHADCSTLARKAYLRCCPQCAWRRSRSGSNNRLVELGTMNIASSESDLVKELGSKSADQAIRRLLGVGLRSWSYPLEKVALLTPSLRDSLMKYRGYPAATELDGLKVTEIFDADLAKSWGLTEGAVLLQVNDSGPFPSLEDLACLVDLPEEEEKDGISQATILFHLWLPSASSVSVIKVPLDDPPETSAADPIQGTRFSIWGVDSRIATAEAIKSQLTMRGATFLGRRRWQMLATCDVTTSPADNALSDAVKDLAEKTGLGKLRQWTDATLPKGQFVLSIGSKCLQQ